MTRATQVFIVGMNGSGTTLLLDCLAGHSMLYGFRGETKVLPFFIAREKTYGDLGDDSRFRRLWQDLRTAIGGRGWRKDRSASAIGEWGSRSRSVAAIFDAILSSLAAAEGKSTWCEKTPMYVHHVQTLAREFPEARFIHILRDGRACAASFNRRWRFNPVRTIFRWKQAVRAGRSQGSEIGGRYLEVRYEQLTGAPEACLRQVCAYLEVPFEEAILRPARLRPEMTGSSEKSIARNERSASDYFGPSTLGKLERVAGRQLAECGYSVSNAAGDSDPPRWLLRWWEAQDDVRRFLGAFGTASDMHPSRRLAYLSRSILAALRQKKTLK